MRLQPGELDAQTWQADSEQQSHTTQTWHERHLQFGESNAHQWQALSEQQLASTYTKMNVAQAPLAIW